MNSREHRRVRLRLPARLRWTAPFGHKIELCETIDVSRSGLLVSTRERHATGVSLWVTFPYDPSLGDGQAEILANVVRCSEILEVIRATNGRSQASLDSTLANERSAKLDQLVRVLGISSSAATFVVALHFEEPARVATSGNGHRGKLERRSSPRSVLAVPVRVRPEQMPWFEEAMAIDFSAKGMRFRTQREYLPGDQLRVAFDDAVFTPWRGTGEFRSRVVRVVPAPDHVALDVSVCRAE
jgi:PilZ domain-containing protein